MHLLYYDEVKYQPPTQTSFWLGGICAEDKTVPDLEAAVTEIVSPLFGSKVLSKETEIHGIELCRGKGNFKHVGFDERMEVLKALCAEMDVARETILPTGELRGRLRIAAPLSFGPRDLAPVFAELARRHPLLQVHTSYSDRFVDIVGEGFDCAVRVGYLPESNLVARRVGPISGKLVASPAYIREYGAPQTPEELLTHQALMQGTEAWQLTDGDRTGEPLMLVRSDIPGPLLESILDLSVSSRGWNGVRVDVREWRGFGRVLHKFPNETETRLITLLEDVGSASEPRLRENRPSPIGYTPRHMDFAPAGLELWGFNPDVRFVKDATLTFDLAALGQRLTAQFDRDVISTPRLRFSDDRVWNLVKLLADTVNDPDPSTQLYGDGLTAAIAARLFSDPKDAVLESGGLAPWQLRRVVDYMDSHLPERVDLADLAGLVGLSQSHFSRAFKASTGLAPYHWQLDARIRRAQALLIDTSASLDLVAEATGFADAVHFGRTFRKLIGATPAAWRRDRKT